MGFLRMNPTFVVAAALLTVSPSASADPPRPRVLFVVDTTGSMNSSLVDGAALGGDGSDIYPGDDDIAGIPHINCAGYPNPLVTGVNCGRVFQSKQTLLDLLAASPPGTGLMRFTQLEAQSEIELLTFDTGYYDSPNNLYVETNFTGAGCGSYNFSDTNFWQASRGSPEAHPAGGDLLVEVPFADALDTRDHVAKWLDHLERWWIGGDPGSLDFPTWSETVTLDDGGYPITLFTNKELRSVSDYSVTMSTLHEAWTYMNWLRLQDPVGDQRRYLVFPILDGDDACAHDVTELEVYWDQKAPTIKCLERFGVNDCPTIELYPVLFPGPLSTQLEEIANVAWSGDVAGSSLSYGKYFAGSIATEVATWIRMIVLDADPVQIFSEGFEIGDSSRWSDTSP